MASTRVHKTFVSALRSLGKDVLNLSTTKRDVTATIIAMLPAIVARSVTAKTLVKAFTRAGVIDKETHTSPSISGVISTMRRPLTIDEQKFFYDQDFFKYFYTHAEPGYMQEPVYNDVAVPHDYDERGTIELRDPGISQER